MRGALADRQADLPHPRRQPLRAVAGLGRGALALSRLCLRRLRRRRARGRRARAEIRKVVVTLGTYKDFGFPRWSTPARVPAARGRGPLADRRHRRHRLRHRGPPRDPRSRADARRWPDADVVVAHAGVGTALAAFEVGKCPVLVPRRLSPERARRRPPDPDRGRARRSRRRGRSRSRRAGLRRICSAQPRREVRRLSDPPPLETDA